MAQQEYILIVDDEAIIRHSLHDWLCDEGYRVSEAENGMTAIRMIAEEPPDVAVVDIKMPGMDGVTLLKKIKELHPELPVIIMTAFATVENAVQAMKEGAYDFITKPFPPEKLSNVIKKVLEYQNLQREYHRLKKERKQILHIAASILVSFIVLTILILFIFNR